MPRLSSLPSRTMTGTSVKYIPPSRQAILTLSNPNAYGTEVSDKFGSVVASSSNYVVASAPIEDTATVPRSGKVYVFSKLTGSLLYTLTSPVPGGHPNTDLNNFGASISISGTNLIIGAPFDSSYAGRVYVYELSTGSLLRTIQPSLGAGYSPGYFGYSVDTDGDYLIVGALNTAYSSNQQVGYAELFSISSGSSIRTFLNPAPSGGYAYDDFGTSVAISGTKILISAPFDDISGVNVGRAYLFDRDTGSLLNTFTDPAPITDQDQFPYSVDLNSSYIIMSKYSTKQVYVYDASTYSQLHVITNPNIDPTSSNDNFGGGMSRLYGNVFAVGASAEMSANTGVVYLYDLSSGTPTTYTKAIQNPLNTSSTGFGNSGINIDEDSVIVGAATASGTGGASWSGKTIVFDSSVL